ncbi:MAG: PVC-type heme-binding CxxCH protein [Verrucomicrobiales bacterium]
MMCLAPSFILRATFPLLLAAHAWLGIAFGQADELTVDEADLPRLPPLATEAAVQSIQLSPGFRIELAAAEPEVVDPIAIAFDETGALYVAEMRDYSERRAEKLSRIKRLVDRDRDGRFESATVFLDGLAWATGLACWNGGLFIAASPDIVYARDTTGDGVADQSQIVFTGFATGRAAPNVQALVNSLTFGPDNRIWGAAAGNGGIVAGVRLDGADFAFDPATRSLTAESGTAQYGLTFDAGGRRFVCSNSHHLQWVSLERPHASHPLMRPSHPLVDIPVDGPAAEVFRLSPEEPWRIVRTNWRASGVMAGIVEGGGRASGYFTSASGLVVYTGDLMPGLTGQVFIGDVGSNLVHRKQLRETEEGPVAERVPSEARSEFLASRDTWFRPVACANAPDGALWVVDMYREVIEHPDSLPPMLKRHLDLNNGNDRGRLYRIVPAGVTPRRHVDLSTLDTPSLAALTNHPNGWHRTTARRLLVERQDAQAVPGLRALPSFDALAALDGLRAVEIDDLRRALTAPDEAVVRLGVQLLEKRPAHWPSLRAETSRLANHSSFGVRRQWALALRHLPVDDRTDQFVRLWHGAGQSARLREAIRLAVTSGAESLALLRSLPEPDAELVAAIGRDQSPPATAETAQWLTTTLANDPPRLLTLTVALNSPPAIDAIAEKAREWLLDPGQSTEVRTAAAAALVHHAQPASTEALTRLFFDGDAPDPVRAAAWPAVAVTQATKVWSAWPQLSAAMRARILERAVAHSDWQQPLLEAVAAGRLSAQELTAAQAQQLRSAPDAKTRALASDALGPSPPDRQTAIAARLPVLRLSGDPALGETVFRLRCLTCHRHGTEGAEIGPDRITFRNLGKPTLLAAILDPNREVAPRYLSAAVTTTLGETWQGLLLRDDTASIALRLVGGQEIDIPRPSIASYERLTRSLMPDGLETGLSDTELADLLEFLIK